MDCIISVFPFSFVASLLAFHLFLPPYHPRLVFVPGQKDLLEVWLVRLVGWISELY